MRWYLRFSLSFRDVEELLTERGLEADHTTIWRWVQPYGPKLEQRLRVDETFVRVKAAGAVSIGPSILRARTMPRRPNGCSARP